MSVATEEFFCCVFLLLLNWSLSYDFGLGSITAKSEKILLCFISSVFTFNSLLLAAAPHTRMYLGKMLNIYEKLMTNITQYSSLLYISLFDWCWICMHDFKNLDANCITALSYHLALFKHYTAVWSNVRCRPVSGASGPINVVVTGGAVGSSGGSHLQRLSPVHSDTEFSRYVWLLYGH